MKAFEVQVNGKILDYRVGGTLDVKKVAHFLEKTYSVRSLWQAGRHVVGTVEKNGRKLFFKLATTEGISFFTKIEYEWNEAFNIQNPRETSNFWVPQNVDSGLFEENFYIITDTFNGHLLAEKPRKSDTTAIQKHVPAIIEFSELIQKSRIIITERQDNTAQNFFWAKTRAWFEAIPEEIRRINKIEPLLTIVRASFQNLQQKTRHGDFTPWHLFTLSTKKLGLIDGEHAIGNGVEYYDIAYFIQRIFSVSEDQGLAKDIVTILIKRKYNPEKLRTVLAARAIGGYLDESLKEKPDYAISNNFAEFVFSLH